MARIDYDELARTSTADQFVTKFPYCFIVGNSDLCKPQGPGRTEIFQRAAVSGLLAVGPPKEPSPAETDPRQMVFPLRKQQSEFASMITVGRTSNNDIYIADVEMSRFHAFFRAQGEGFVLADAGSRNGTFIGGKRLPPKGAALPVHLGDILRFGRLEFTFLDARGCWDRLSALY